MQAQETLTRIIINSLLVRKKLPQFYFHEEAKRAGIKQSNTRSWRIRGWPNAKIRNRDKFHRWRKRMD